MTEKLNPKIKELADQADMIIRGFAFTREDDVIKVINLNNLENTAVLSLDGHIVETTMCDIEAKIVTDYYAKNKKFIIYEPTEETFEDILAENISANPDLPPEFIKDILIAKELPREPFSLELEE